MSSDAFSRPVPATRPAPSPVRILVVSDCRLGDSLVRIPALRLLRQAFPGCRLVFTSERAGGGIVAAREVLEGRGLVDSFEELATGPGVLARGWRRLRWLLRMRRTRWDLGVVLTPASPPTTLAYLGNLRRYLRLCGAGRILSPGSVLPIRRDSSGAPLPMPHVADQMLEILRPLGIPLPAPGQADASLPPLAPEPACPLRLEPGGRHLAVGCGANMPANLWPLERYAEVLAELSRRHGVVPVYLGGSADAERCARLQELAPGPILVGRPLGQVEAVMRRCLGYLGNDTGLVHLAAAVGIPCVGVYSNRNPPGLWDPYVPRRGVLRPPPCPCAGCGLTRCDRRDGGCISRIAAAEVLDMCEHVLFEGPPRST